MQATHETYLHGVKIPVADYYRLEGIVEDALVLCPHGSQKVRETVTRLALEFVAIAREHAANIAKQERAATRLCPDPLLRWAMQS